MIATSPPFISRQHLLLPAAVLVLTAPLWFGVFEPHVFYFFNRHLAVLPDIVWSLFSLLGTGWAIFAFTAPALWRAPRVMVAWLCAAPLAGALTRLGKMMADNPRPLEVLDPQSIHLIGEPLFVAAMPSGHSITAFAGAPAIYFSLAPPRRRRFLWLYALSLCVALSRTAVGAHCPASAAVAPALAIATGLSRVLLRSSPHPPFPRCLAPRAWLSVRPAAYCFPRSASGFTTTWSESFTLSG